MSEKKEELVSVEECEKSSASTIAEKIAPSADKETLEALQKFTNIIVKMSKMGLLDLIEGLIDEEVIGRASEVFVTTGLLKALDNFDKLTNILSEIDYDKLDGTAKLINSTLEALSKDSVKPVGLFGAMRALRDKDAKKGLGLLIEILKAIGRNYNHK